VDAEVWRVACVWLPRLPLRVEILRRPELDGQPLVLGGGPGERKVVQLCSAEAERAGVRPGLPLREVVGLCPEAAVLPPDPVRIAAVLEEVAGALERVGPSVAPSGEQLFLDLRGLARLYGRDLGQLERAIRAAVPPPLRPRIGVADGPFVASVASRAAGPAGMRAVPSSETVAFLAPQPIARLPLPPEALRRLELLGLRRIGDLAALPFGPVQAQLGAVGARAWRLANGQDDEPVAPRPAVETLRAALRFEAPLASVEAVMRAVDQLLADAFGDPRLRVGSARQAHLRALLSDDTSWERLITFKEPLSSRGAALVALKSKLSLPNGLPPAPIEELRLELRGLGGAAARQLPMFGVSPVQVGRIVEAARQLRARYGRTPLYHPVEVEPWSRIPERRWALTSCEH
jgi:DNA polymerase-4/protein ImuB